MAIYEEKPHNISQLEEEQEHETQAILHELEGQRVLVHNTMNFGLFQQLHLHGLCFNYIS